MSEVVFFGDMSAPFKHDLLISTNVSEILMSIKVDED